MTVRGTQPRKPLRAHFKPERLKTAQLRQLIKESDSEMNRWMEECRDEEFRNDRLERSRDQAVEDKLAAQRQLDQEMRDHEATRERLRSTETAHAQALEEVSELRDTSNNGRKIFDQLLFSTQVRTRLSDERAALGTRYAAGFFPMADRLKQENEDLQNAYVRALRKLAKQKGKTREAVAYGEALSDELKSVRQEDAHQSRVSAHAVRLHNERLKQKVAFDGKHIAYLHARRSASTIRLNKVTSDHRALVTKYGRLRADLREKAETLRKERDNHNDSISQHCGYRVLRDELFATQESLKEERTEKKLLKEQLDDVSDNQERFCQAVSQSYSRPPDQAENQRSINTLAQALRIHHEVVESRLQSNRDHQRKDARHEDQERTILTLRRDVKQAQTLQRETNERVTKLEETNKLYHYALGVVDVDCVDFVVRVAYLEEATERVKQRNQDLEELYLGANEIAGQKRRGGPFAELPNIQSTNLGTSRNNRKRGLSPETSSESGEPQMPSTHASPSGARAEKRQRLNESRDEQLDWLQGRLIPLAEFPYLCSKLEREVTSRVMINTVED